MATKTSNKTKNTSSTSTANGSTTNKKSTSANSYSSYEDEKTLDDLFEDELKDMYSAEKQLVEALPKMAKAADSEDLQDAFENHLEQTKKHVDRLEKIFDRLGIDKSEENECEAMKGLIQEGEEIIQKFKAGPVRDAALIMAAQKVEHYEIASYGSLRELADVLGCNRECDLLHRTLQEEGDTDHLLSQLAMDVNDEACELAHTHEDEYQH